MDTIRFAFDTMTDVVLNGQSIGICKLALTSANLEVLTQSKMCDPLAKYIGVDEFTEFGTAQGCTINYCDETKTWQIESREDQFALHGTDR